MLRKIVQIDEERCDGCGLCVPSCAEGAIRIVNGKAVLSADNLCDGLGACLGDCPQDAIRIIEREADPFDEDAVEHQRAVDANSSEKTVDVPKVGHAHGGCPGSRVMTFDAPSQTAASAVRQPSRLGQWPVQLHLVPVNAPYFQDADLLIAADCVPFAYPGFHSDFLSGKALVVGCPKLDDNSFYRDKLTQILKASTIKSVTVLRMEVPCCGGIVSAAREALKDSGKSIPFKEVVIGIRGDIMRQSE
jgi:NAD-dependent dihydropyrimidine dehydrogenase PreA subunit